MSIRHIAAGYHAVTPFLSVRDAVRALDFYKAAFGAVEAPTRMTGPDGKILVAEIRIGDSMVLITEENPAVGHLSPQALGGTTVRMVLYVEDVDAVAERAMAAGAKLLIPVSDQFYGDRSGRLADPFGHIWVISTHKEDVSPEEMQRRAAALFSAPG